MAGCPEQALSDAGRPLFFRSGMRATCLLFTRLNFPEFQADQTRVRYRLIDGCLSNAIFM